MFDFGQRLRQIREENNMTQKQFADCIGSTERGIRRYEAGERLPAFNVIIAILDNVDVSADYLLGRTDVPEVYRSYKPNAETIAAMKEAEAISNGTIPTKTFNSVDELMEDLMSDVED